eukprot:TRINITY_DN1494_c0_g1_i1.p1 TRINITY_DN1494_c0_g1~~TRINITY_DN1494_c0_g1_i1.p1  ORF type:complete len:274 (+),score=83.49 TRINITY_DN1494_c0_g1_i1:44-865(+)
MENTFLIDQGTQNVRYGTTNNYVSEIIDDPKIYTKTEEFYENILLFDSELYPTNISYTVCDEKPYLKYKNKNEKMQLFFETFKASNIQPVSHIIADLVSLGQTTGTILSIGYNQTQLGFINDLSVVSHKNFSDFGGCVFDIPEEIDTFDNFVDFEMQKRSSINGFLDDAKIANYQLPDDSYLLLSQKFDEQMLEFTRTGLLNNKNIFVSGNGALGHCFHEFEEKTNSQVHHSFRVDSTFFGMAILSIMEDSPVITRQEYEEVGLSSFFVIGCE